MKNRGQLQISFGMIFSIILIIAVVAVSFYVIQYFMKLSNCTSVGLFYNSLQEEVDSAWAASSSRQLFSATAPSGADYICFGNMTQTPNSESKKMFDDLYRIHRLSDSNVFAYPQNKGCQSMNSQKINHAKMDNFFCIDTKENIELIIMKDAFGTAVSVSKR